MRARLSSIRLDALRLHSLEMLRRGFPVDMLDPAQRHALELAGTIDRNRRGLRRFLKHHFAGNSSWLATHPETQRWFRKHSRIDPEKWLRGLRLETDVERFGRVVLEFERDPLEVLRLGTYVGSCLSVGGLCDYSAAAVLLDVNKQVVYARDRYGAVVGRQLVAISDDDRLLCFLVYPGAARTLLNVAFREFDLRLASELGVDVVREAQGIEVENVLSQGFWFDDLWNLDSRDSESSGETGKRSQAPPGAEQVDG